MQAILAKNSNPHEEIMQLVYEIAEKQAKERSECTEMVKGIHRVV